MLGKLLKYDLKWIYKNVVVLYILAIVFSLLSRITKNVESSVLFSVITIVLVISAIFMAVASLVFCLRNLWFRFLKNCYQDESYLTHTLPVKKKKIYDAKVITAVIAMFTTIVVILISLFICFYSKANLENIKEALEIAATVSDTTVVSILFLMFLVFVTEMIFIVFIGYSAMILGHRFNQNKIVKSIMIGIGLYFITQIFSIILVFLVGALNPDIMNFINTDEIVPTSIIKKIMYAGTGLYIFYTLFYYLLGKICFKKGVNVD